MAAPTVHRARPPYPIRAARHAWGPFAAMVAVAATLAATLGGCGSSPSGTSASPATVTPASAPLYVDAVVRPEGSLKTDAISTASALTGRPKPFEGLLKLLQGPTGKTPSYSREVEPWLGPHAGVFLSAIDLSGAQKLLGGEVLTKALGEGLTGLESALLGHGGLQAALSSSSAQGALVLDTTDVAKARSFLEAQAHSAGAHSESYRGVTYQVSPGGVAEGIVRRFAVIGSETGMKSVIETAAGGPSLAQAGAYAKLSSTAESTSAHPTALANVYLSPEELTHSVKTSGSEGGGESIVPLLEGVLGNPGQVYLSVIPSANTVAIDLDTLPSAESSPAHPSSSTGALSSSGAQVLRTLPGSAWLAAGIGDLGGAFGNNANGLRAIAKLASSVTIGSISFSAALAPLSSHTLDAQRDLLSWMGATGLYVSGSSVLSLQGAVVITTTDSARSRAAFPKIAQAYREAGGQTSPTSVPGMETADNVKLPNFPLTLTMALGQGMFVVGLGPSSVQEAVSPKTTLAGTPTYEAAASALGQGIQPSALIEAHTLSGLIESLGLNQAPGFSGFATAVAPLSAVSVGGGKALANGVTRARVVINLQPAES
jgi:hypothetical protein